MKAQSFHSLETKFAGRGRILANNTRVERISEDCYAVRLHATNIVVYYRNGRIEINSGGWQTVTTKARINDALRDVGAWITQRNHEWTLHNADGSTRYFHDGMIV